MFATIPQPNSYVIICYTMEECEQVFKDLCPKPRPLFKLWDRNRRILYNDDRYFLIEYNGFQRPLKGTSIDKIYIKNNLTEDEKKHILQYLYPTLREHSKDNVIYK